MGIDNPLTYTQTPATQLELRFSPLDRRGASGRRESPGPSTGPPSRRIRAWRPLGTFSVGFALFVVGDSVAPLSGSSCSCCFFLAMPEAAFAVSYEPGDLFIADLNAFAGQKRSTKA